MQGPQDSGKILDFVSNLPGIGPVVEMLSTVFSSFLSKMGLGNIDIIGMLFGKLGGQQQPQQQQADADGNPNTNALEEKAVYDLKTVAAKLETDSPAQKQTLSLSEKIESGELNLGEKFTQAQQTTQAPQVNNDHDMLENGVLAAIKANGDEMTVAKISKLAPQAEVMAEPATPDASS